MSHGQNSLLNNNQSESIFGKATAKFGAKGLEVPSLLETQKQEKYQVDDNKLLRALRNEKERNDSDQSEEP